MRKFVLLFLLSMFAVVHADEQYLGLYMGGSKVGYSSYSVHPDVLNSKTVSRTDSKTVMSAGLLGTAMQMTMEGSTWSANGRPLKMLFVQSSAGRVQKIVATFGLKTAEVDVDSEGQKTHKSLPIPSGGLIVDDPLELVIGKQAVPGQKVLVYILDPTTVTFMKNEVVLVGRRKTSANGKPVEGTLIRIVDPRMTMDVYVSSKGDLVKVDAPMGIEMIPESKTVALANKNPAYKPSADLAFTTSIRPDKNINDPAKVTGLTMRITGHDLSRIPSDDHQTVKKEGAGWLVDVHPPKLSGDPARSISEVAKQQPEWVKPSLDIPSDSAEFKRLSATIVKGQKDVLPAALAIKQYVNDNMQPNAGIGVLRDASEILRTKEGVCRDYAILTVTLMRSAGIPARLASGVVNWQGDFYYHAWAEIWDGARWIGIDSTVPEKQMSATHIKLADGNVEGAFAFTFLDKVKIEVLDIRRS